MAFFPTTAGERYLRTISKRRGASMRILVVDDEPAVAYLLGDAIGGSGHEVIVATSGEEALGLLEHCVPDAVFLDVSMPEMCGVEVLRRVRGRHPDLPVFLITGHAQEKQIELAQSLGVSGIVEKPFILKGLSVTLEALAKS